MKSLYLLFVIFVFTNFLATSQTIVSGEIFDKKNDTPIEFASVRLFSSKDSTMKEGAFTNEKGKFLFEAITKGKYYLVVSFAGFESSTISGVIITDQPSYSVGKIMLSPLDFKELGGVEVVGELQTLQAGIDKKVYNVDQDVAARGAGADEVLSNIPSVTLDEEGRVTLRGDGSVTVLINGQPSSLTGAGGNLLSSIPASSIERIEIVTNPSAKYDPDGTSGIINIVLKKNKIRGINGQVSATGGLPGHDHKLSAALNFRNDKISAFASYAFDYMEGYRNNFSSIERILSPDSSMYLDQFRIGRDFRRGHMARLGLDWFINNQSTIGFSTSGSLNAHTRSGDQLNSQYFKADSLTNFWQRNSREPTNRKNIDANLYYNYNLKGDKGKLSSSVNYSTNNRSEEGHFSQESFISNKLPIVDNPLYQNQFSSGANGIFTGQVDFEQIVPKIKARYEVGAKTILRSENLGASSNTFDYAQNAYVEDTFSTFDYKYNENVFSVYGVFGQELGKFKYQVGLRGEYVLQDPKLLNSSTSYRKEYTQLYPSAHVKYALARFSELSLGYSRRVNRPSSWDLNPFANYSDPFNLRVGNPSLKPEFIHSVDIGYSHIFSKLTITSSVYYRHTSDVIQRVKVFYNDKAAAVTMANIDNSQTTGIELVLQYRPFSWWKNTFSFNGNYIVYADNGVGTNWNNKGFNWGIKYTGSFDFWKKTATVQLNAVYNAPRVTAQGTIYMWNFVDVSVQKQFFDKKLVVGLKFADVFDIKGFRMKVNQPTLKQESKFDFQTQRVYLTLTYKFGKMDISNKQMPKDGEGGGGDF